jgi:hypothetical protein
MKNQYFGDINDYRKYGLLRILTRTGDISTTICWMLTHDDSKTDGKKIQYLQQQDKYRQFDPLLFDFLHKHVAVNKVREVSIVENANIIPATRFYSKYLDDNRDERTHYFADFNRFSKGCDLVFFDPDNGIEVKSVKSGNKNSSKYLYWQEIISTFDSGHSCLIYQHFPQYLKTPRTIYIKKKVKDFAEKTRYDYILLFKTPNVLFLLASQRQHQDYFKSCSSIISKVWNEQIEVSILHREFILEHF